MASRVIFGRFTAEASRAPLICLVSSMAEVPRVLPRFPLPLWPLSIHLWLDYWRRLLCGRMKLFNLLRLFSHLPFVYTNTCQGEGAGAAAEERVN